MSKRPGETKIGVTIKGDKIATTIEEDEKHIEIEVTPDQAEDWGASLGDMAAVLRKEQARKIRRRIP